MEKVDWKAVTELFTHDKKLIHLGARSLLCHIRNMCMRPSTNTGKKLMLTLCFIPKRQRMKNMQKVREAAARYFGMPNPDDIAVTDSTTMGLGLIYTGLNIQKGQEILTTDHDHYSQHESIRLATERTGASYRKNRTL
jgi:isopenicillin-N epimerase